MSGSLDRADEARRLHDLHAAFCRRARPSQIVANTFRRAGSAPHVRLICISLERDVAYAHAQLVRQLRDLRDPGVVVFPLSMRTREDSLLNVVFWRRADDDLHRRSARHVVARVVRFCGEARMRADVGRCPGLCRRPIARPRRVARRAARALGGAQRRPDLLGRQRAASVRARRALPRRLRSQVRR